MGACTEVGSLPATPPRDAGQSCWPLPGGGGQDMRLPAAGGGGAETWVGEPRNGADSDCAVTVGDGAEPAPDWAAAANWCPQPLQNRVPGSTGSPPERHQLS